MLPIAHVGIPPTQLAEMVEGEVWDHWLTAEPDLAAVGSLAELDALRGLGADSPLGALVRLAARDGGDDELAGIAVVHQLEGGVRQLIRQFRNLTDDVEAVVIGALWEKIRTFPWQRRTQSYAANLLYDTRAGVIAMLLPGTTRRGHEPIVFLDPQSWMLDALAEPTTATACDGLYGGEEKLADLLRWAIKAEVVTGEDARLLVELVLAGHSGADAECPQWARGACSLVAVAKVAQRRGLSTKTVKRQRDHVVTRLRETAGRYLVEAA